MSAAVAEIVALGHQVRAKDAQIAELRRQLAAACDRARIAEQRCQLLEARAREAFSFAAWGGSRRQQTASRSDPGGHRE
jgi:hypothetical protein